MFKIFSIVHRIAKRIEDSDCYKNSKISEKERERHVVGPLKPRKICKIFIDLKELYSLCLYDLEIGQKVASPTRLPY